MKECKECGASNGHMPYCSLKGREAASVVDISDLRARRDAGAPEPIPAKGVAMAQVVTQLDNEPINRKAQELYDRIIAESWGWQGETDNRARDLIAEEIRTIIRLGSRYLTE